MATPFLSEIKIMGFNFAPKGWAFCSGQIMAIAQNQALFSLLGTTFGGNGQTTFALPNLQGRTPIHFGNNHTLGELGGELNHTLSVSELPTHTHTLRAVDTAATTKNPTNNSLSSSKPANQYSNYLLNPSTIQSASVANAGGGQPHSNMQPFLTVNFCIALVGAFPSRN